MQSGALEMDELDANDIMYEPKRAVVELLQAVNLFPPLVKLTGHEVGGC